MASTQLIINADDLGYDPAVNDGLLRSMTEGIVTSATLMVNTRYATPAAARARGLAIGLHLNLARDKCLSGAVSKDLLNGDEFVEDNCPKLPADAVEKEVMAQLDTLDRLMGQPATHIDVHKHKHLFPNVMEGLIAAAKRAKLPVRSINPEMRAHLRKNGVATNPGFIGDAGKDAYWTMERLRIELEGLGEGLTELMCHPGFAPSEVKSGYNKQREVELQTFVHPGARALVERRGIQLVDFRALAG